MHNPFNKRVDQPEIELGDQAKDTITGFIGTVISITTWLYACKRVQIQPNDLDKDGKPVGSQVFDYPQLELISKVGEYQEEKKKTGGPSIRPVRAADPV